MKKVKLQVPMDEDVRDGLERRANELGFDSAQAYIRFWAKAQANRTVTGPDIDDWGQPSDKAAARLNRWAEEARRDAAAGRLKSYGSVEEFLSDLKK